MRFLRVPSCEAEEIRAKATKSLPAWREAEARSQHYIGYRPQLADLGMRVRAGGGGNAQWTIDMMMICIAIRGWL